MFELGQPHSGFTMGEADGNKKRAFGGGPGLIKDDRTRDGELMAYPAGVSEVEET